MQSSFQRQEPSPTAHLFPGVWITNFQVRQERLEVFYTVRPQTSRNFDRSALAPRSPPSNVRNAAGGAGSAAGIGAEGSHSGVDTLSTTLHPEGWIQILQKRIFHLQQCGKEEDVKEGRSEWHKVFAEGTWQGLPSLTAHFYGCLCWQPQHFPSDCSQTQELTALPPWDTTTAGRALAYWRTGCPENQKWNYLTSGLGSSWTNDFHVAFGPPWYGYLAYLSLVFLSK